MKCTNCSRKISSDSAFCEYCGHKIDKKGKETKQPKNGIYDKVLEHLEFLGYTIESKNYENTIYNCIAFHTSRNNINIRFDPKNGFNLSSTYTINKDKVTKNSDNFLVLINELNMKTAITCFTLNEDNSSIGCYAWYPAFYSKQLFGNFLETFYLDIQKALSNTRLLEFS